MADRMDPPFFGKSPYSDSKPLGQYKYKDLKTGSVTIVPKFKKEKRGRSGATVGMGPSQITGGGGLSLLVFSLANTLFFGLPRSASRTLRASRNFSFSAEVFFRKDINNTPYAFGMREYPRPHSQHGFV